ncbi:MAG: Rrf2 family transcriptional regulator [Armatimonadetes bacterium]|nr:Rrf2 family transcriptional regulator [Armatimonadota bacterium]
MPLYSWKVDYALRTLLDLCQRPEGQSAQSRDIAARQDIPEAYLTQLLVRLRQRGLVRSVRGAAGGYHLGRSPSQITVGDVVRIFHDEDLLGPGPDVPAPEEGSVAWVVRDLRARLEAPVRTILEGTTLADLEERRRHLDEAQSLALGI